MSSRRQRSPTGMRRRIGAPLMLQLRRWKRSTVRKRQQSRDRTRRHRTERDVMGHRSGSDTAGGRKRWRPPASRRLQWPSASRLRASDRDEAPNRSSIDARAVLVEVEQWAAAGAGDSGKRSRVAGRIMRRWPGPALGFELRSRTRPSEPRGPPWYYHL